MWRPGSKQQVRQEKIDPGGRLKRAQRVDEVRGGQNLVAGGRERPRNGVAGSFVVLDQQNDRRAGIRITRRATSDFSVGVQAGRRYSRETSFAHQRLSPIEP